MSLLLAPAMAAFLPRPRPAGRADEPSPTAFGLCALGFAVIWLAPNPDRGRGRGTGLWTGSLFLGCSRAGRRATVP